MFERNIIDLVGLFIENVQSLYPFLGDLPWGGATGPVGYPGQYCCSPCLRRGREEVPTFLTQGKER